MAIAESMIMESCSPSWRNGDERDFLSWKEESLRHQAGAVGSTPRRGSSGDDSGHDLYCLRQNTKPEFSRDLAHPVVQTAYTKRLGKV